MAGLKVTPEQARYVLASHVAATQDTILNAMRVYANHMDRQADEVEDESPPVASMARESAKRAREVAGQLSSMLETLAESEDSQSV